MKKLLFAITTILALTACKDDSTENKDDNPAPATETFEEGEITVSITTPGSPLGGLLQKIDPAKGNFEQQMEEAAKDLTPEEIEEIDAFVENNPMLFMVMLFQPLRTTIYCKDNEASAKFDALTYHGENRIDFETKSGQYYAQSQADKSNAISYNYKEASLGNSTTNTPLDSEKYNINKTNETEIIAGYECRKSVYTLKGGVTNTPSPYPQMNATISKLEVWTSDKLPLSLNFVHPLYVKEEGAIMRLKIYYQNNEEMPFVYNFDKVEQRSISDEEMNILKADPVYDYDKDFDVIGPKLIGIMFGGTNPEAATAYAKAFKVK